MKIKQGFTLMELLLVIIIVGVLAQAMVITVRNNHFTDKLSAETLKAKLRYAQLLAVSSGCDVAVNVIDNQLLMQSREHCTFGDFQQPVILAKMKKVKSQLIARNFPLYFTKAGTTNSGQNSELQIADHVITVIGATGFIQDEPL